MSTIRTFSDLDVWKKSHELVLSTYNLSSTFPKIELFGLTSQIRRSASSIPANIVEGFRRQSMKESLHFYNIADASLEETKYHVLLAKDLHYISEDIYLKYMQQAEEVGRLLTRWIQSQRKFIKA